MSEVRWSNFLGPGLEVGVLFGSSPERKLNLSAHVVYAPTLFPIDSTAAQGPADARAGAVRFGLSLDDYVPFFDFD